jgi:hypothetical protein
METLTMETPVQEGREASLTDRARPRACLFNKQLPRGVELCRTGQDPQNRLLTNDENTSFVLWSISS